MQVYKTNIALPSFNIPANAIIAIEANQSWLDGESPDRYAGSIYVFNEETKKLDYYGFIHEDTMATVGMFNDDDWCVKEGYCKLGDIGYHASVSDVPMNELPKELFTLYFQAESKRMDDYIKGCPFTKSKHFVKTSDILKKYLDHSFLGQFKKLGLDPKAALIKAVKAHNNSVADSRAKKEAVRRSQANSLENLCPELKNL